MANERLPDSLPHRPPPRPDECGDECGDEYGDECGNEYGDPRDAPALPYATERAEIEAAAARTITRSDFPSEYVDLVNEQAARFTLRTAAPGDIRAAIALLEEQTNVQALAPTDSSNRGVATAKKVVRKAVFFTVHHLTEQMRALGWATTSVGIAAAERIEQLEARVQELEARLAGNDPRADHGDAKES